MTLFCRKPSCEKLNLLELRHKPRSHFLCAGQTLNPKKNMVNGMIMGPYAGVDYNHTLCPLQSRLQHIYHGIAQPYARVDLKGTVSRDFLLLVFFLNQFPPSL